MFAAHVASGIGDYRGAVGAKSFHHDGMIHTGNPAELAGKIRVVGFDAAGETLAAIEAGNVDAAVVQDQWGCGFHTVRILAENVRAAGLTNVRPVVCTAEDPKLPEGEVDLILMVDVYHECAEPEATLQGLRKALKPGGRLVLVEFRAEDSEVPIKPEHKMTLAQVRREIEPQGFTFKESLEFLPWQHIILFEKPATPQAGTGTGTTAAGKE